jgi:hypothetical protein
MKRNYTIQQTIPKLFRLCQAETTAAVKMPRLSRDVVGGTDGECKGCNRYRHATHDRSLSDLSSAISAISVRGTSDRSEFRHQVQFQRRYSRQIDEINKMKDCVCVDRIQQEGRSWSNKASGLSPATYES